MGVEVRELVIKALVVQDHNGSGGASKPSAGNNNNVDPQEQTIKIAVERVLEILKSKDER